MLLTLIRLRWIIGPKYVVGENANERTVADLKVVKSGN